MFHVKHKIGKNRRKTGGGVPNATAPLASKHILKKAKNTSKSNQKTNLLFAPLKVTAKAVSGRKHFLLFAKTTIHFSLNGGERSQGSLKSHRHFCLKKIACFGILALSAVHCF